MRLAVLTRAPIGRVTKKPPQGSARRKAASFGNLFNIQVGFAEQVLRALQALPRHPQPVVLTGERMEFAVERALAHAEFPGCGHGCVLCDQATRDAVGDFRAVVAAHDVQTEIDAGSATGGGQDAVLVAIERCAVHARVT